MKRSVLLALPLIFMYQPARAGSIDGSGALSLAALVGQYSPVLKAPEKQLLLKLLYGQKNAPFPAAQKVTVAADAAMCRVSDVDITLHLCELTFGSKKVRVNGRAAHELYATLAEVGVPADGAAGTIVEGVTNLSCEIDPAMVKKADGGGAHCSYDPSK